MTIDPVMQAIQEQVARKTAEMEKSIWAGAVTTSSAPPAAKSAEEMLRDIEELQKKFGLPAGTIASGSITPAKIGPPPQPGGGGLLRTPTRLGSPPPWAGATPAKGKTPGVLDSLIASATEFTRSQEKGTMTDAEKEAAKAVAAAINAKLGPGGIGPFQLNGPAELTIKTRQGGYNKKSFLGDEEMRLTTAYGGSRDGVICVFKNTVPVAYNTIEIPLSKAREILTGFSFALNTLDIPDLDNMVTGIQQKIESAAAAEQAALIEENPVFGSW